MTEATAILLRETRDYSGWDDVTVCEECQYLDNEHDPFCSHAEDLETEEGEEE